MKSKTSLYLSKSDSEIFAIVNNPLELGFTYSYCGMKAYNKVSYDYDYERHKEVLTILAPKELVEW